MLKLKRFDEGSWFEYQPGVEFKIKPISKFDLLSIRARCKRKIYVQGMSPPDNIIDDVDPGMMTFEILRTCLLEVKGIEVGTINNPTHELLIQTVFEREELVSFIISHAHNLFESEEKKLGEELKNSESSQNG